MNVKNGTASSVSFDITPQTRSGSACTSDGVQQAELNAEQRVGDADRGERERDRIADQQHDDQRHEHQRRDVRDQEGGHLLFPVGLRRLGRDFRRQRFFPAREGYPRRAAPPRVFTHMLFARVGDQPHQEGDALDQLGDALHREQEEADRHQQARRPDRQAAGVGRYLVAHVGVDEHRPAEPADQDRHRQQKEQCAEDVDPRPRRGGESRPEMTSMRTCSLRSSV